MSLRLKLLLGVGVTGLAFALFAVLAWNTIGATKVNGPAYKQIGLLSVRIRRSSVTGPSFSV